MVIKQILARIFVGQGDKTSRNKAKQRLKFILAHDRVALTPQMFEAMRNEILQVVSKYVELDQDSLEISLETDDDRNTFVSANMPIRSLREETETAPEPNQADLEASFSANLSPEPNSANALVGDKAPEEKPEVAPTDQSKSEMEAANPAAIEIKSAPDLAAEIPSTDFQNDQSDQSKSEGSKPAADQSSPEESEAATENSNPDPNSDDQATNASDNSEPADPAAENVNPDQGEVESKSEQGADQISEQGNRQNDQQPSDQAVNSADQSSASNQPEGSSDSDHSDASGESTATNTTATESDQSSDSDRNADGDHNENQ